MGRSTAATRAVAVAAAAGLVLVACTSDADGTTQGTLDPSQGGQGEQGDDPNQESGPDPDPDRDSTVANPPSSSPTMPVPLEQGGPGAAIDDASQLIGRPLEDGAEWATSNGVAWRVLSSDGVTAADESPFDPTRISFVVEADLIVRFEWS